MLEVKHLMAQAFEVPALRKLREERGTLDFADAS
jgi:hypothetical protein